MADNQKGGSKVAEQAKVRSYARTAMQSRIMFWCYMILLAMFLVARFEMDFIFVNFWTALGTLMGYDWAVGTNARIDVFIWGVTLAAWASGLFLTKEKELSK